MSQHCDRATFAFQDESRVHEALHCSICAHVLNDPITHMCRNTFCRACIEQVKDAKCPACRVPFASVTTDFRAAAFVVLNLLDDLPVCCTNLIEAPSGVQESKCSYQCKRGELIAHQRDCIVLPCAQGCAYQATANKLQQHYKDYSALGCPETLVTCQIGKSLLGLGYSCGWEGKLKQFFQEHKPQCPYRYMNCLVAAFDGLEHAVTSEDLIRNLSTIKVRLVEKIVKDIANTKSVRELENDLLKTNERYSTLETMRQQQLERHNKSAQDMQTRLLEAESHLTTQRNTVSNLQLQNRTLQRQISDLEDRVSKSRKRKERASTGISNAAAY